MNAEPVLVDVNIPMYAAGQPHTYKESCIWVMQEIAAGRISAAIDAEIIQEILYRYGALKRWDLAGNMATDLIEIFPVTLPITLAEVRQSIVLFRQYGKDGLTARDAIHAAVMKINDIQEIISTDEHFDNIEGITRLDPRRLFEKRTGR